MVENHYDFINVHHHKSNVALEKELKRLGEDDTHSVEVYGEKVYLPSPNLHAIFLIRHASGHFASEGLTLRQVLDWAFYMKENRDKIDWPWLMELIEKHGMKQFFDCINAICVDDLGFDSKIFPYIQYNPLLKERIIDEILNPEFSLVLPNSLFSRLIYKYRRWKANRWKRVLCYNESDWDAFWYGVWNHLLKPSSI